ncbi:MAG: helix-turn-helix transcriptional regulator [Verrucomicrobiota bacterium]
MKSRDPRLLTGDQLRRFSEAIELFYEPSSDPVSSLFRAFETAIPSTVTTLEFQDSETGALHHVGHTPPVIPLEDTDRLMQELGSGNPNIVYMIENRGIPTAVRALDFVSHREFRQSGFYREINKIFSFRDQAATAFQVGGRTYGFASFRDREFEESEMTMLELMKPHFARAFAAHSRLQGLPDVGSLSVREKETLWWLAEGKSDSEIGELLSISYRTVSNHVASVLRKLGVENRTAAAVEVWRYRSGQSQ